jgi:hypothetical protein
MEQVQEAKEMGRPRLGAVALGADPVDGSSPLGRCVECGQPIYTAFYVLPAVRDRRGRVIYTMRVHVKCFNARSAVAP